MTEQMKSSSASDDSSVAEIYDRITDAVFALDEEWRFTFLNEEAERVLQRDEEELLGEVVWEAFPDAVGSTFQREYERAMETQEPVTFEEFYPALDTWFSVSAYPSETGLSVYFRDVTERVRQKEQLQKRERALKRAYEVITDPDQSFQQQVTSLLEVVRETIGTHYATLSRVQEEADTYIFEAIDAPDDVELEAGDLAPLEELPNCATVVETEQTLVLKDVEAEAPALADPAWGIACYLGAPVTVDGEVYGTFCFYGMEAKVSEFTDWEVTFVELLSNWVGYELQRKRNTDRLAAINDLNGVVRDVTDTAITRTTREDIEAAACRCLADSDSYEFAWIGEANPATQAVQLRTEAGAENYLEDVTISVDANDEESLGPTGQAFRTGEMQTVQNVRTDSTYEPWLDSADAYGYQSSAAVPIVHEDTVYGVLNVYADRTNAFEGQERPVMAQLGEILGHAIASAERKQTLTSDTVVELEFRVKDVLAERGISDPPEGTIVYDEVLPVGDGEFLVYGTTSETELATMNELVDRDQHWEEVMRLEERNDGIAFGLRVSQQPLLSTVASLGGAVEHAMLEGGDYQITVHLPEGADVRQILESVRATHSTAEIISKRRAVRQDDLSQRVERTLTDELTDRQRVSLRAAFFAGYFEWPRDASAEDVAEQLDVSAATFHEHLRVAENKLLNALLGDGSEE